jgi:hypothetical protein
MYYIDKEFVLSKFDTEKEKEFAKEVLAVKEKYYIEARAEIDRIIVLYAQSEAIEIVELYKKYFEAVNA